MVKSSKLYKNQGLSYSKDDKTQVGSPALRLRLARCTAWVKRWSEAMDFLQIIFKTKGKIESSHDFQGT